MIKRFTIDLERVIRIDDVNYVKIIFEGMTRPRKTFRAWTNEDKAYLVRAIKDNLPIAVIAQRLERNEASVYTYARINHNVLRIGKYFVPRKEVEMKKELANDKL